MSCMNAKLGMIHSINYYSLTIAIKNDENAGGLGWRIPP